ncbi:stress responsive a/B barrel domain-containing protein [Sarocladium implicatum]|nr:stress responsive a/B barrel domain-containing protein [Sarocladium implicatum]
MTVNHIVLFQFREDVGADTCEAMMSLKNECLHPTSQKPYIKSLTGGRDHSIENRQCGIQYAFVAEFASLEDRDYYVTSDPAHQSFVKIAGEVLEKAIVVDYTQGSFEY